MVDNQGEGDETDEDLPGDPTAPLLSFDTDTNAMPHWADAPTGEMPVIDPGAEVPATPPGGSRLFPQLPDDPNMVDESGTSKFDAVRSDTLPSLPTELTAPGHAAFAPPGDQDPMATGPLDLPSVGDAPADPVADTTVIRGLGERDPGAEFDGDPEDDRRDEERRAAAALGNLEYDSVDGDISGSAALTPDPDDGAADGPADERIFSDEVADDPWSRLDALPDLDGDSDPAPAEPGPSTQDVGAPIVEGGSGFPTPPDVTSLFDEETPAVAAPLGSGRGDEPPSTTDDDGADKLDDWADLDAPAPHWREGSQDYEERAAVNDDERTVLHFDDAADDGAEPGGDGGGRNVPVAIAVGLALAAVFFGLLSVGPGAAMVLVVVALVLAAAEFYQAVRNVGYRPAALLGLATVGGLAAAVYWKGLEAYPLVLGLSVVVGLLWFLFGVESEHATANLAITFMGVGWIGVLGSFAAMILKMPNGDAVLIGAVIGTAAYDVGGYVIGRTTGQSRLAPNISPNKTYEGLIGGMILSIVVTTLVLNSVPGIFPWTESMTDALWLGVVVAVMAPLGDLTQSLVKRDLGVKDMGTLLPGHGGVFDRFDALLFVLPGAYYVADLVLY